MNMIIWFSIQQNTFVQFFLFSLGFFWEFNDVLFPFVFSITATCRIEFERIFCWIWMLSNIKYRANLVWLIGESNSNELLPSWTRFEYSWVWFSFQIFFSYFVSFRLCIIWFEYILSFWWWSVSCWGWEISSITLFMYHRLKLMPWKKNI